MHLLVDPVMLCCPIHMGAPVPIIVDNLAYLTKWGNLIVRKLDNEFYIPTRCEQALYHENCFLDPSHLRDYFKHFSALPYDAIYHVCRLILESSYTWPRFRENAALPRSNIVLNPDLCRRIPNRAIADSLRETLGYIAWAQAIIDDIPDLHILTYPTKDTHIQIDVRLPAGQAVSHRLPIVIPP